MSTDKKTTGYAARLKIDYPEKLDRLTTLFRLFWIIPNQGRSIFAPAYGSIPIHCGRPICAFGDRLS